MKDKDGLKRQVVQDLQMLIGLTPTGPERERLCDINIALLSIGEPPRPIEIPEFDQKEVGEWAEVNQHQFLDGSGFSYHLGVPKTTRMIVICKDIKGRVQIVRPVKSLIEYLNFKHEPVVKT